jgi:hypothetical protein
MVAIVELLEEENNPMGLRPQPLNQGEKEKQ